MPDVKPLRYPSREGRASQQDQADLQVVCSGRRRTCALLNSPSPFVNNAVYHMLELKVAVEHWCQQCGKYQPHIDQDKNPYSKNIRFHSGTESVMFAELFVEGVAISARGDRESCPLSPLLKTINQVLAEVVCLVERLEADRQHAEEALHKEKKRKRFLENKVHSISLWKQQEHCLVVQKEHEACNRDISELRWQLRFEKEKLEKLQVKLADTEVLNQCLHEDIDFVKKQIPIMEEKLDLQRTIAKEINSEQATVDEVNLKMQNELLRMQEELKELELEAKNEKASLDNVVVSMKDQLADRLEDSYQLTILEKDLSAETSAAEKTIAVTEERCATMTQRIPELIEQQTHEKKQISDLKSQLEDEVQRNKKLKEKLSALQEDIEKSKHNGEAEVSCIEEQLHSKCDAFAALRKENMEYEQSIEDYKMKISKSEKAVKQMCTEREHMLQKAIDNHQQWEKAKEEVTRVVARHSVTQTRLDEREQLTCMEEQRARTQIQNLQNDLTGHMTILELLKAQCAEIEEAVTRQKRNSELSNQRLQAELEDASSTAKALQTKVQSLKNVTEHLENIQREHQNKLLKLEMEKKHRHDNLRAAQDLYSATVKICNDTQSRITDLTTKSRGFQDASRDMEKIVESMPEVIEELQMVFDVVDFRNKSAAVIMSTLQSDINNCQRQTQRSMQTHTTHVTARKKEMVETEDALRLALQKNKQLAYEYEHLKRIIMNVRQEEVSARSNRNHEHRPLLYYAQLSLLQKRMHKAWVEYFKRRRLHSRAELDRCQALSQETERKIKTAQERLSEETQLIAAFLRSLTDDSAATDDAAENLHARPDAAGSKE